MTERDEYDEEAEHAKLKRDYDAMLKEGFHYRQRAITAELEVSTWKSRFDALLKIVPPTNGS